MTFPFLLLSGFFLAALAVRAGLGVRLCALCISVTATWLVLFYEYWFLGGTGDPILLGVLMGGSAVGGMYYLSAQFSEQYQIFKFPFLLSSLYLVYRLIIGFGDGTQEILILGGVWVVFGILYLFFVNKKWQAVGRSIIECCKNW